MSSSSRYVTVSPIFVDGTVISFRCLRLKNKAGMEDGAFGGIWTRDHYLTKIEEIVFRFD